MSYFSPRSTWMSLVESPGSFSFVPDPCVASPSLHSSMTRLTADWVHVEQDDEPEIISDLETLKCQRDLRHRLFFHHREWEFGPSLLEDNIQLAQAQSNPQEAIAFYEEARLVAKSLAENYGESSFVPAWLEVNRVLSEIYNLQDQSDQSVFYAREGLQALKQGRFDSTLDPYITKLAVRFWSLLGRVPV